MSDKKNSSNRLIKHFIILWTELFNAGQLVASANLAQLALNVAKETNNRELEKQSIASLKVSLQDILAEEILENNSPNQTLKCSFCGKSEPEVKLAAGSNAFICDGCVEKLKDYFDEDE